MPDVNIKGKIQVDTGSSAATMKELKDNIKNLKTELDGAKIGSREYTEASEKLKAAQMQLSASTKEKTSNFAQLKETLKGTVPAFEGASSGAAGLGRQLLALLANPVVLVFAAIAVALKGLYEAFTHTLPGAQKMEQIFTGMKAAMTVLTDRLVTFGNAIIKLFTGDFKGAADDAKKAFTGIGDEIGKTYNRASEIRKQLQKIAAEERQDDYERTERAKKFALIREKLYDESTSAQEKLRLSQELREEEQKNAEDDLRRIKEKNTLEIELINQKTNLQKEDLDKINELKKEINQTETQNSVEGFKTEKLIHRLRTQINTEATEQAAELAKAEKAAIAQKYKDELEAYNKRKKLRDQEHAEVINMTNEFIKMREEDEKRKKIQEERMQKFEKESNETGLGNLLMNKAKQTQATYDNAEAQKKINEGYLQHKKILFDQEIQLANTLSDLAGQQTAVGKGISIASATINTYHAATEALKGDYKAYGPLAQVARIVAVASTIALGLKQVKSIAAVNIPNVGSSASVPMTSLSSAASNATAPLSPQPTNTRLDEQSIMKVGNAAAGGVNRSFVLDADIKNNAERAARINRAARLG